MRGNLLTSTPSGGGFNTLRLNDNSKSPDKDGIITFTSLELRNSHEHDDRYYRHDISDGRYYTKTDASNTFAPKSHEHDKLYIMANNEANLCYGYNINDGAFHFNYRGATRAIKYYVFRDGMQNGILGGLTTVSAGAPYACNVTSWGW